MLKSKNMSSMGSKLQRKTISLDQKFWAHFSERVWEKKPIHIKNIKSPLREIGETEIFNMLVVLSNRSRQLKSVIGFKFYIDGQQAHAADVLQVLPIKQDKSLLGYHQRMNALFSDYCLVCDELLQVNSNHQAQLTDFTNELYRQIGFPNRFSELGLYLGNYRKTPFGVHVDRCGVFSFPVRGQKKFRLWTSDFVKKNPSLERAFSYEKYKKNSQVILIKPGDLAYWPSSAWHIAESSGAFSATWSLGVWVDRPHQQFFFETLELLIAEKLGARGDARTTSFKKLYSTSGEVTELPQAFLQTIELLRRLTTLELKETFLKSWMQHISGQGFKNNSNSELKLLLSSYVRLKNPSVKILWKNSRLSKEVCFLGFRGISIETKKSGQLMKFVKAINAGKTCLLSDFMGRSNRLDLKSLQRLADAGAFA